MSGASDFWVGDSLKRPDLAANVRKVIATMHSGGAFGLDAPFGHGKTFFVNGLANELKAEGYTVAYFDAWKADIAERPLFHFVTSLLAQLADQGIDATAKPGLVPRLSSLAAAAARIGVKSLLRAGDDDLDALLSPIGEEVEKIDFSKKGAAADALALLDDVETARSAFATIVQTLIVAEGKKLPLVVFIDELDRARPDFAIDLLEALKFVFATEHVTFCLSVDKANLTAAIRARFGATYDVEQYLSRIFEFWIKLENPGANATFLRARLKARRLIEDKVLYEGGDYESGIEAAALFGIAGLGPKSSNLRAIDRCAERIAICARQGGSVISVVAFLAGLSVSNPALIDRLNRSAADQVLDQRLLPDLSSYLLPTDESEQAVLISWILSPQFRTANSANIESSFGTKVFQRIPQIRPFDHDNDRSELQRTLRRVGWALG